MRENLPPGAVVLEDMPTAKSHNKQQYMENSMKGESYSVLAKDLERGYVDTGENPGEREFYMSVGVPRLIY